MPKTPQKETLKTKAAALWKMAGGPSTFATQFEPRLKCYSAEIITGGRVAVYERVKMGYAMVEVPRKIAQAWDEMEVDYKNKKGEFSSRCDGGRWNLYMDDGEQLSTWAQNIEDAVQRLKGGG